MKEETEMTQKWDYRVVSDTCYQPEIGAYTAYGIALAGKPLCLRDISCQRSMVEHIAKVFNRLQVSPVHFYDAVENMLP